MADAFLSPWELTPFFLPSLLPCLGSQSQHLLSARQSAVQGAGGVAQLRFAMVLTLFRLPSTREKGTKQELGSVRGGAKEVESAGRLHGGH